MKLKNNYIIVYYSILYLSLVVGFLFGEDFARGFRYDFEIHKHLIQDLFNESLIYGLINYDENYVPHSPLFIIYIIIFKKLFISEEIFRFFNLHIFLLIPFFIGLCLKLKYNLKKNDIRYLLPSIFFISPYFRAGAIWTDDNVFALIFFCISLYYFINYEKNKLEFKFIILNTIFLAIACYFRPIYCIFSIYFFIIYYTDLRLSRRFLIYVIVNLLLAFPAFYYVFILEINKWALTYLFRENVITQISLASTLIFFYFFPFIIEKIYKEKFKILNLRNLISSVIIFTLLLIYFNYEKEYSGGIFFRVSNVIFDNNIFYFIISTLSVLFLFFVFFKNKKNLKNFDFLLIIILFLLEIDGVVYHETYDPLLYILILVLFKNKIIKKFISEFNYNKFVFLLSFVLLFYLSSAFRTIIF